ncbi:MAG: hypothetical protein CM1200mP28_15920 [Deltaproteobacteria bacterium]|nr:MAG: hypothetical protein CM1200mP28_15920 [Deltaproteobacteria bacterium]
MLNLESLLQTLSDWHTAGSIEDAFYMLLSIELKRVTRPKCRLTLRDGEKWLSPQEFPKAELEWISAAADCEKLFQRNNLVGEPGKILRAWVIQKVLGDIRSELRKTKMEQGVFDFDDLLHLVEEQVNPGENSQHRLHLPRSFVKNMHVQLLMNFRTPITDNGIFSVKYFWKALNIT